MKFYAYFVGNMAGEVAFGVREIFRETVLGYLFWSLFPFLAPLVWFFPLNAMEVSGYEAFLAVLLSPVLVGPAWVRRKLQTRTGLGILRVLAAASLASFQASDTVSRLAALAAGNFVAIIVVTASLWSPSLHQRSVTFWGLILGMFVSLVSRVWYTTYLPTWYDTTSNNVVIAIVAIATIDKIVSGEDGLQAEEEPADKSKKPKDAASPSWVRLSVAFGSLLFLTLWVFGDSSVVLRWGSKSHPDTGPQPYPWGFAVLLAMAVGVYASSKLHKHSRPGWLLSGLLSFICLNYADRWAAFAGGLGLAVFTMSLWPLLLDQLTQCPPGRSMGLACLTWILVILYEVWTVAYNFVPGGVYTREHTDHLIVVVMGAIAVGVLAANPKHSSFFQSKKTNNNVMKAIILMLLLGAGGYISRLDKQHPTHPPKDQPEPDFTAAVWAFHFGYDNKGWPSVVQSSDFIRNTGADVIGLLETDASKPFMGNHDLVMWLSERLGMYSDFGPSTRTHCWGVALISKYPIIESSHHLLPSPHGELAPAIMATVNMTGKLVDFLVTHMGNEWDSLDRQLQAEALSDLLRNTKNPVVFIGYVTSKPGSRDYTHLITKGNVKDIDDTDKKRFCEYILYRGLKRLGYARVSHGGLSDTEVQMARFRVPENPADYRDNERITTDPQQVDKQIRFYELFGPHRDGHNWGNNHRFHMNTPKYFLP